MKKLILFICFLSSLGGYAQKDTLSNPKDSLIVGNEEKFQKDVIEYSKKDNLLSKMVGLIINEKDENGSNGTNGWDFSYKNYEKYNGKIIKDIEVINIDVFGNKNTGKKDLNFLAKAGNAIHVSTQPWIIKQQLLFKEGEPILPFIVSESERLLRSKSYLYSANIEIVEDEEQTDSVSVRVKVRDVWSITPDASINLSENRGYLEFEDINFLGYGMTFFGAIKRNYTYGKEWSIDGGIRMDNLLQQHITGRAQRLSDQWGRVYRLSLAREFISPLFKWAGGVDFSWSDRYNHEIYNDTFNLVNEKVKRQEYWVGYATDFSHFTHIRRMQNEFYIAAGYKKTRFADTPEIINEYYGNNELALISLGYAFRRYSKTRYVRYMGRTEDIPTGTIVSVTGGSRYGANGSKFYGGVKAGYSFYMNKFGYLSAFLEAGSYYNQGKSEIGSINGNILYFSPLARIGNTRFRNFLSFRTAYLHNPYLFDHLINLDQSDDIRGFSQIQTGNKKLTINYEVNLYPPINILGFNFAVIAFADLSWLIADHRPSFQNGFYQGFGMGLRIRNELLVFRSIQFLLGYYPNGMSSKFNIFEQPYRFYDLDYIEFEKPGAVIE